MGKQNNAFELSAWTTGAGIAIGTNIDVGGVLVGTATTVTVVANGSTVMSLKLSSDNGGAPNIAPVGLAGPVTCTSSGGSFAVLFRRRNV